MVHPRVVAYVPHLELSDLDGFVAVMLLVVHAEIDAMREAHLLTEMHLSRWRRGSRSERLDVAQLGRNVGVRRRRRADAQRRERFGTRSGDCLPVVP